MADETIEYSPEEMAELQGLFEPLGPAMDPETNPFIPLEKQFNQELEEIRSFLNISDEPDEEEATGEIPEEGEDEAPAVERPGLDDYLSSLEQKEAGDRTTSLSNEIADDFGDLDSLAEGDGADLDDTPAPAEAADDLGGLDDLFTDDDTPAGIEEPAGDDPFATTDLDDGGFSDDLGGLDDAPAAGGDGLDDFAGLDDLDMGGDTPADTGGLDDSGMGADDFGGLDALTADSGEMGGDDFGAAPAGDDFGGLDDMDPGTGGMDDSFGDLDGGLEGGPGDGSLDTSSASDDFGGLDDMDLGGGGLDDSFGDLDSMGGTDSGMADDFGSLDGASDATPVDGDLDFAAGSDDLSGFDSPEETTMDFGDLDGDPFDGLSPEPMDAGGMGDDDLLSGSGDLLDSSDLADMSDQARMEEGIGDEFTDEDLAKIRTILVDYPPGVKKAVIDAVVNDKISSNDQRLLMNMLADQAEAETIAGFLETRIGYRPDVAPSQVRRDGVQIIYADGLSPEDLSRKKKRARTILLGSGLGLLAISLVFGAFSLFHFFSVRGLYEQGLEHLKEARFTSGEARESHIAQAEDYFSRAVHKEGSYDVDYLNRYGVAYMQAGYHEQAFIKIFGKIKPDYQWSNSATRAPLLRPVDGSSWPGLNPPPGSPPLMVQGRDGVPREVLIPGAYIVSRIRDGDFDRQTLLNLGRFHSRNTRDFLEHRNGRDYKNDELAIDYYRLILTLMDRPDDTEAMAGIGKVYYDSGKYAAAAQEYNRILDIAPMDIQGHAGLLHTYLEIWKKEKDPRYVIARHRLLRNQGLEDDLPIYLLTKLAGFYIDLNRDTLRVRYQVDPVDAVSGMDIQDNVIHLLKIAFTKEEKRDDEIIYGSRYGEGFYQRGRYLMGVGDSTRALKQFQNAHMYDNRNYLAINAMGEYYMKVLDYDRAEEYFREALKTNRMYKDSYGSRPEDETLIEGDTGKLYFNLGNLLYLRYAGMPEGSGEGFPDTRIYPDRALGVETTEMEKRRERLRQAGELFQEALENNMKEPSAIIEATYRLGWIDYIGGDFESALRKWEELETIYSGGYSDPNLVMGRGNAYYYTDQTRSSLGSYLKVQDDLQRKVDSIRRPNPDDQEHRRIFLTLSAVHNNLGAVYEKEYMEKKEAGAGEKILGELEKEAMVHYWSSVELSRKVDSDNEIARTNLEMSFKRKGRSPSDDIKNDYPLIDDWVPPTTASKEE